MKKSKIICVLFSALFSFITLTSFTILTKENDNNLLEIFENESIIFNYNKTKYEVRTSDYYFYLFSGEKIFADPIDLKNNVANLELVNWKVNSENGKIINSLSLKIEDEFINVTSYDMTSSEFSNLRETSLQGDENIKKKVIIKTSNALESLTINNTSAKTRSMPTNSELESMTSNDRYIDSYQPDYDYFDNKRCCRSSRSNVVYQLTKLQVVEDNIYVNIFRQVKGTIDLITYVSANRYLGEYQREI